MVDDLGYALSVVQHCGRPPSAKVWKGEGPGVFETGPKSIVAIRLGPSTRCASEKAIYVLHCFQQELPSGIRTAKQDIVLIHERLRTAQKDYEVRYARKEED